MAGRAPGRWSMLVVLALLLVGCGKVESGPRVGEKAIAERGVSLWSDLAALQEARVRDADDQLRVDHPEHEKREALNSRRSGTVFKGALLEVVGIGPGWTSVVVVRDEQGRPGTEHGYCVPTWYPRMPSSP